jgi:hypothetical protein
VYTSSGTSPDLVRWDFVAVTWDGTKHRIYVNTGAAEGTDATALPGNGSEYPFVLGGYYSHTAGFVGTLDEAMVFSRALSQSELEALQTENPYHK